MKPLLLLLLSSFLICIIHFNCRKDILDTKDASCKGCDLIKGENVFVRQGSTGEDREGVEIGDREIVLGSQRPNPFSVTAMTQAWNTLYPNFQKSALPATHLYVKFKPTDLENYKVLEASDLPLFTFPLDYEIIEDGDWYNDPTIPDEEVPWLYTVVKANFQFPNVPHQIIERLVLAPMKSPLTKRSFRIMEASSGVQFRDECEPDCPNWPECEDVPALGCGGNTGGGNTGGGGTIGNPYPPSTTPPPCDPTDPENVDWMCYEEGEPEPPGPPTLNSCGCPVSLERYPSGCIKVVDTQLPPNSTLPDGSSVHLDGVDNVKVTWWNGYFGVWDTYTDSKGCWKIANQDHGVGRMWVTFKNDRAVIRGLRGAKIWEYAFAVKDAIGKINGPVFNNISVIYGTGGGNKSASRLFWYAATCNNALAEAHAYAVQDGTPTPPGSLDILLSNRNGAASAPMFDKTGQNWELYFSASHVVGAIFRLPVVGLFAPVLQGLATFISIWAPDVVYAYGDEAMVSDDVKETFYHEFAHTIHYRGVSNDYWKDNVSWIIENYVLQQPNVPYVGRDRVGHERCAIIESWGFHTGPQYADRTYGLNHSRTASTLPIDIERRRWKYSTEFFIPDVAGGPADNYIPMGLCLDLVDNNATNPSGVVEGLNADVISGFTIKNYFDAITLGDPTLLSGVESNLNTMRPPGVSTAMLRAMMIEHGY